MPFVPKGPARTSPPHASPPSSSAARSCPPRSTATPLAVSLRLKEMANDAGSRTSCENEIDPLGYTMLRRSQSTSAGPH